MQVWSVFPTAAKRKILGFPGEILSIQGGFSRSERQNLEAREGKVQSRRSREEKLDAKPPSSLTGRTGRTQSGNELPQTPGI